MSKIIIFILTWALLHFYAASAYPQNKPATPSVEAAKAAPAAPSVEQVLARYGEAIGGRAAWEKITSVVSKGVMEMSAAGIKAEMETYQKAPNKMLVTMNLTGMGDFLDGFDGVTAWSQNPMQGYREKSGAELAALKRATDLLRPFKLAQLYAKLEMQGKVKVGEREAYLIVATPNEGAAEKMFFDTQSGLLVRSEAEAETPQGKFMVTSTFEDHRAVNGIQFPFRSRQQTPMGEMLMTVIEIKPNVAIDDAKFSKPAAPKN